MDQSWRYADSTRRWFRRSRRYSPFDRSPGIRRVPDDAIGVAIVASLVAHAALIAFLIRATASPPWSPDATMSLVGELVASPPPGPVEEADPPRAVSDGRSTAPADDARPPAIAAAESSRAARPPEATLARAVVVPNSSRMAKPSEDLGEPPPSSPASKAVTSAPASRPANESGVALVATTTRDEEIRTPAVPSPAAEAKTALAPATVGTAPDSPIALAPPPPAEELSFGGGPPEPPWSAGPSEPIAEFAKMLTPARVLAASPTSDGPAAVAAHPRPRPEKTAPAPPLSVPTLVASAPVTARETNQATSPASPLGLASRRSFVVIEGARERVSGQPTATIAGRLLGAAADRLVLYVNGAPIVAAPTREFQIPIALQPGSNTVRAVVSGPDGVETDDVIGVRYAAPTTATGVTVTSPRDGLTLGPEEPPVVVVEGDVEGPDNAMAWIVANGRRTAVTVRRGRFRHVVLVTEPQVDIWAETASTDEHLRRSQTVTVRRSDAAAATGVLVMQWPAGTNASDVEVNATWRAQADRLDAPVQTMSLPAFARPADGSPSEVFYLRGLKAGVYTLAVRYRGAPPSGELRSTLYVSGQAGLRGRPLDPARLEKGRVVLARILMPYGVEWSQDDWFSGASESVDTVTKFRVPEGISWVEPRVTLP